MKNTPHRQNILDTLSVQTEALSARALSVLLPDMNQATVYRNLELLERAGEISKFTPCGSEALYETKHRDHHHAICRECETIIHIHAPDEQIVKLLDLKEDFEVDHLEVIVKGRHKKHPVA